jgi:hypothetical protein
MKPGHQAKLLEVTTDKFANQQQFTRYKEQVRLELSTQL